MRSVREQNLPISRSLALHFGSKARLERNLLDEGRSIGGKLARLLIPNGSGAGLTWDPVLSDARAEGHETLLDTGC